MSIEQNLDAHCDPAGPGCCSLATGPLEAQDAEHFADLFKELSDPTRLRLLSLLAADGCQPVSAGDLVVPLGVTQPTVSHHLTRLTEAGLLRRRREGKRMFYCVNRSAFAKLQAVLALGDERPEPASNPS